jgi:DNA-binding transcriptional regulator YdaS (Cro superfamily)
MRLDQNPTLLAVFKHFGSAANLARQLGVTRAAVSAWKKIPLKHVPFIVKHTGIKREKLRPDIYA